jgi:hypothetical protein
MKNQTKKILTKLSLLLAPLYLCMQFSGVAHAAVATQSLAVPMYQYPTIGTYWTDINSAAASSHLPFELVDPANGPGTVVDPIYTSSIADNTTKNIRSIGYVDTSYQARSYQDAYNDIDQWYQMYPGVTGIFLDQIQEGSAADRCYIASLYNHVKNTHPDALVVINPGTHISQAYEPYSDIFLNAENTYAAYSGGWTIQYPGWEDNAAYTNRFWQIIHTTSSGQYANALSLTRANNAGFVFITDDTMPNPYDVTPSYWTTEKSDIATLPATPLPNRGKTQLPDGCQNLTASTTSTVTTAAKSVTTKSNITVANPSSTYNVEPATKVAFSLPGGVTLSGSGTNWTCGASSCSYNATINASQSAAVLGASFATSCSYSSGTVSAVLSNFAGNTFSFSVTPTKPGDCTLADTGLSAGLTTGFALSLVAAATGVHFSQTRLKYRHATRR